MNARKALLCLPLILTLVLVIACTSEEPASTDNVVIASAPTPTPVSPVDAIPTPTQKPSPSATAVVPTPTPESIESATPTPPPPTATATPMPFANLTVQVEPYTTWEELLDDLYPHERSCVTATTNDLDRPILEDIEYTTKLEVELFGCLEPGTARAALVGVFVSGLADEAAMDMSYEEVDCLQSKSVEMDALAVVTSLLEGGDEDVLPAAEFYLEILRCASSWFARSLLNYNSEMFDEAVSCIEELFLEADVELMAAWIKTEDTLEVEQFMTGLWECGSDEFTDEFPDDHSDSITDPTDIEVGQPLTASTEYIDDLDYFAFESEEGNYYQIRLEVETSQEIGVEFYSPYPEFNIINLAYSDDQDSDLEFVWKAPYAGKVHIGVFGWDLGTYTLRVDIIDDIDDDHGNFPEEATSLNVGEGIPDVRGSIDYTGDVDVFELEAEEDMIYSFTAHLDTLGDSYLYVEDSYGQYVVSGEHGPDYELAANVVWKASESAFYFIFVEGLGTGTYLLSGSERGDDHGDSSETGTQLEPGEWVNGDIAAAGDIDYFTWDAEEDVEYMIEANMHRMAQGMIMLYDRRGEIEFAYTSPVDNFARIRWQAPSDGPYWISVENEFNDPGSYDLVVWAGAVPQGSDDSEPPLPGKWEVVTDPFDLPASWSAIVSHLPLLEIKLRTKAVEHSSEWDVYLAVQCHVESSGPGSENNLLLWVSDNFDNPVLADEANAFDLDEVAILVDVDGWEKPEIQTWNIGHSEQFSPKWLLSRSMHPWGHNDGLRIAKDLVANNASFLELAVMGGDHTRNIKFDTSGAPEVLKPFVETCVGGD